MCLTLGLQLVSFVDCFHFFIYSFIYLLFIFWDFHTCICVSILSTPMTSSTPPRILLSLYVFFLQCTGCNQYCLLCAWVSWGHPLDLSTRAPYSPLSHHGPRVLNGDSIFLGSLETSGGGASWRKLLEGPQGYFVLLFLSARMWRAVPTPTCLHNCIRWNNQELNPLKPWAKINPPSFTLLEPAIWSQWWWTDQYALIISCCSSVNMGRASYTS